MKMQKTAMFISVMTKAVPHFTIWTVFWLSAIIEIRFMIICINNWISKTQKKRIKNNTGTLSSC